MCHVQFGGGSAINDKPAFICTETMVSTSSEVNKMIQGTLFEVFLPVKYTSPCGDCHHQCADHSTYSIEDKIYVNLKILMKTKREKNTGRPMKINIPDILIKVKTDIALLKLYSTSFPTGGQ